MRKGDYLFVYGTLRRGEGADLSKQGRNRGAVFMGVSQINGLIYNLGHFPGVKCEAGSFDPGQPSVHGDVFLINDPKLPDQLDAYEGYPNLYTRLETEAADGRTVWVYVYNHEVIEMQRIQSGDWYDRGVAMPNRVLVS
jgi:gamma-glutamylcyclotransferase (GGCT)/AIG2-like uncharacterized protein YtfP